LVINRYIEEDLKQNFVILWNFGTVSVIFSGRPKLRPVKRQDVQAKKKADISPPLKSVLQKRDTVMLLAEAGHDTLFNANEKEMDRNAFIKK
jgi:hypothetical protein